jgi:hypothetical protein
MSTTTPPTTRTTRRPADPGGPWAILAHQRNAPTAAIPGLPCGFRRASRTDHLARPSRACCGTTPPRWACT